MGTTYNPIIQNIQIKSESNTDPLLQSVSIDVSVGAHINEIEVPKTTKNPMQTIHRQTHREIFKMKTPVVVGFIEMHDDKRNLPEKKINMKSIYTYNLESIRVS